MGLGLDPVTTIAVICAIGVALTFGIVAVAVSDSAAGRRFDRRVDSMRDRAQGILPSEESATRSLSRQRSVSTIDRLARTWLPRRDLLAARLARTGRTISIGQYAMASAGLTTLAAIGLAGAARIGIVPSLLLGLLIGTALPHFVIGRLGKRRLAAFIALFPDAIDLIVRALRSGLPVSEAIVGAGHEIADPVGAELRLVENGMRMGRDLESLLWDTAKRIDAPEFRFFVIALSVQRETGGNLAEILDNLSYVIRERFKILRQVRVHTAQGRLTMLLLMALPPTIVAVMLVINPGFIRPLFTEWLGHVAIVVAISLQTLGYFVIRRIIQIQV
jgi:tight adherence protein B